LNPKRKTLLGLPLDSLTQRSLIAAIEEAVATGSTVYHASLNAAKVVTAEKDDRLRAALWRFDFVSADGQSVVWAARMLKRRVPERLTGIDLMEALAARSASEGWRVYLLGAKQEILELAISELKDQHPSLSIAGSHHGYFSHEEEESIVSDVRNSGADILFVALASPEKELFLDRHRQKLGVAFAMGVGGAFDVVAGVRRRAPKAVQRVGLEWAFRLAQEPRRLGRRYLTTNRRFLALVVRESVAFRVLLRPFRT
jgi:N-acetylglucosaminyldiphosphoundecaprenol N-acetyl-beta-D-mannosaminyltransferase